MRSGQTTGWTVAGVSRVPSARRDVIAVSATEERIGLDAIASNAATHNPREDLGGACSDHARLHAHNSAPESHKIWMAVYRWPRAAQLAADGFERSFLRLLLLARFLVHSWHRRSGARFHGGLVCRYSAPAA